MRSKILYRLNNLDKPNFWYIETTNFDDIITVTYGIVGMKHSNEAYKVTMKSAEIECNSRYREKIKLGYLTLDEIRDETIAPPVEDTHSPIFATYLSKYLYKNLINGNTNVLLPMLAKTYTGNVWKKQSIMLGQYKINGLRCIIKASKNNDIFKPFKLTFQSREGTIWTTLSNLEEYLLSIISTSVLYKMIDNCWSLDGEIYLPGYTINQINHFVKDPTCKENSLLQYWMYDLLIIDTSQYTRNNIRYTNFGGVKSNFVSYEHHLNNKDRFVNLISIELRNDNDSILTRNKFINLGFEGLILRNPNESYQFGRRRVGIMEKYKDTKDGLFKIISIDKEIKRDVPIITCCNDINDETFETRFSCSVEQQIEYLTNKENYIGKDVFITFGERSGVKRVPFHITDVYFK